MSLSVPIFKKFFSTAGVQVVSRGLTLVIGIILARFLGPEKFGLYSFIISIIIMATIPVVAGLPQLLIRELANAELDKKWRELRGLLRWSTIYVFVISSIMMLGLALAIWLDWIDEITGQILWVALLLVPLKGILTKQSAVLKGFRQPVLAQLPAVFLAPLITLICLSALYLNEIEFTVPALIKVQLFACMGAVILSSVLLRRVGSPDIRNAISNYHFSKWHRALLPFTLMAFITGMNTEFASVLLGFLGDTESVGYFKVAMQGVGLIALGLGAVNTVTAPNIARLYKSGDLAATQLLISKSVRLSCVSSVPIALLLIFKGEWIISQLFGAEYLPAAKILSILCVGQIFNVLMGSVALVLNMTGHERRALRAVAITLILNVVLLVILIPPYKEQGAAISVTISVICWNMLMAIDAYRLTSLKPWLSFKLS